MVEIDPPAGPGQYTIHAPKEMAEFVRGVIMEKGLFDPARSIGRDDEIHFPVLLPGEGGPELFRELFGPAFSQLRISRSSTGTVSRKNKVPPMNRIREGMKAIIDEGLIKILPDKWDLIGDCLVLKLPGELRTRGKEIASVYQSVLGARYTLMDASGISGELREPTFIPLTEPDDGRWEVVHVENGIKYCLDPRRIMFSSGNVDERMGIERIVTKGPRPPRLEGRDGDEIVIDMFAGIGYFSLPIARGCRVRKVYALEKNPNSFYYLERNIGLNGVTDKVAPIYGDNREVHPPEKGDRIVMGYVGGTLEFVPRALELSAREGSILHLHDTVMVESGARELYADARRRIEDGGLSSELLDWRRVKSYAPRIDHVVLDILVTS